MSDQNDRHRYLYTVRQRFGCAPELDCFYEVQIEEGISSSEASMMQTLKPDWAEKEISADSETMKMIGLRLRFNSDMYQSICMVITEFALERDELQCLIETKHETGELLSFLDKSALRT